MRSVHNLSGNSYLKDMAMPCPFCVFDQKIRCHKKRAFHMAKHCFEAWYYAEKWQ